MPNPMIQDRFRRLVKSLLDESKAVAPVEHAGLRGGLREAFLRNLIEPLLPTGLTATTGLLVDSTGGQSGQVDVIVYSRSVMPPLIEGEPSMVPVEAAIYSIEVKSKLTMAEVRKAVGGFRKTNALASMQSNARPVPALFGFGSDLGDGGRSELERLLEADVDDPPQTRVLCVLGKGYWYFDEGQRAWQFFPPDGDLSEVVDFLGGFVNTTLARPAERVLPWGAYVVRRDAQTAIPQSPGITEGAS